MKYLIALTLLLIVIYSTVQANNPTKMPIKLLKQIQIEEGLN